MDELEPLFPDRAGVKMPFTNKLRLVLLLLSRAFRLWASRAAVVDARVTNVSARALSYELTTELKFHLPLKFMKKLQEEKQYAKIGAIG